jgi:hypothetical protein
VKVIVYRNTKSKFGDIFKGSLLIMLIDGAEKQCLSFRREL